MCQQVPAVPEALQQTLRDDGTISAWMQLPPLQCPPPRDLPGGCEPLSAWRMQTGAASAVGCHTSAAPARGSPRGGGSGHGAAGACHDDRRVQLTSSVPTAVQGYGSSQSPQTQHFHKPQQFQAETAQALPPRAASAKDLTEIRLELHQVSTLSPQLQARMSFTLPDSVLQVGTLNTRRGITTRDQGQQQ